MTVHSSPKNLREKARMESEMRRMYPGAYNTDGSAKTGKQVAKDYKSRKKKRKTNRTKTTEGGLKTAGMSKSEIDRFR